MTPDSTTTGDNHRSHELEDFLHNTFDLTALDGPLALPLKDEPFVATWRGWVDAVDRGDGNVLDVLRPHLPQLSFPIAEGISQSEPYRKATRQGIDPATLSIEGSLELDAPARLRLEIHSSFAGGIPVFETRGRRQFEALVRALSKRNEPVPISPTQGAQMVGGYVNWSRVHALRRRWLETPEEEREHVTWSQAMAALKDNKAVFQDRFILLSDGPYSAVPASELDLDEATWRSKSFVIRRDHECSHYFTRRLFGSMRNHPMDELMADYAGIAASEGRFRADWFLRFMGVEASGEVRDDGRLRLYRGDPPISDAAFQQLGPILRQAALHVERFDAERRRLPEEVVDRAVCLAALATLRLDELARPGGAEALGASHTDILNRFS